MSQLAFRWPAAPHYTREDFIVSEANQSALTFIEHWPTSLHDYSALLVGSAASGKTHLAHCFAARTGAIMLDAAQLGHIPSDALWQNHPYGVLENIETITDETAFFHLLRHTELAHGHLLMTSRLHAKELPLQLPDLRSRLLSFPTVSIHQPDDALLLAFFSKAFADRQWRVPAAVVTYIQTRTERSFAAAQACIQQLEHALSTTNRELTIPLVKTLLE